MKTGNHAYPCGWMEMDELNVYQKMDNSLHAKAEITAYQVHQQGSEKETILISKPQLLINESVFDLLSLYYKFMSKEKWDSIFGNDNNLILQLETWRHMMKEKSVKIQGYSRMGSREITQSLIPWKAFYNSKEFNHERFHPEKFVRPIFAEESIDEIQQNKIVIDFDIEDQVEEKWAWISRVKLNKKHGYDKLFQPTSEKMIKEVKIYLMTFAESYLNPERRIILSELPESHICEKLEVIFDILWGLNEKLIGVFGCKSFGEDYSHEQKSLQMFFLSCLSRFKMNNSQEIQESSEKLNKKINDKIVKLMVEMLTLENNEEIFTVTPMRKRGKISSILTQEDLTLGQMTVNILGYYYKNKNQAKYFHFFGNDLIFFQFLLIRSSRLFYGFDTNNGEIFEKFRESKIIPWENGVIGELPEISFKLSCRKRLEINKWIKRINKTP
jgi:hypothetical protein